MNVVLQTLFDKYEVSEKNRYDIIQIYGFLSVEKKQILLNNFDVFIQKVHTIENGIILEQAILLDKVIPHIQAIIEKNDFPK